MSDHSTDVVSGEARSGWRFPVERRHVLKEGDRESMLQPGRLLDALQLRPRDTVIDVGAGTGYWTIPLAERVGARGKVFAVDVEPIMLEDIRAQAREASLEQIELILSEDLSIPLDDAIAAGAVLGFVLHEPTDPLAFLREVKRLLRPGGRVLVLDWQKWETEKGPPVEHRISADKARALLTDAGLRVEELEVPTADAYALLGVTS